jgi:plastocyanin
MNPLRTLAAGTLLVLGLAGCGSGAATLGPTNAGSLPPASAPAASVAPTNATPITVRDFKFDTPDVSVTGQVVLAVTNAGPTIHDLSIRDDMDKVLGETADLKPNTSETLTVDLPTGVYRIFCAVPGHESLGIKGTLTVAR